MGTPQTCSCTMQTPACSNIAIYSIQNECLLDFPPLTLLVANHSLLELELGFNGLVIFLLDYFNPNTYKSAFAVNIYSQ